MSDPVPPTEPPQPFGAEEPVAVELEVDLASFLPEGVTVAGPAGIDDDADGAGDAGAAAGAAVDLAALDQVEADLDAVDAAIAALDAGTYGIDPVTGAAIDDAALAEDPTRVR